MNCISSSPFFDICPRSQGIANSTSWPPAPDLSRASLLLGSGGGGGGAECVVCAGPDRVDVSAEAGIEPSGKQRDKAQQQGVFDQILPLFFFPKSLNKLHSVSPLIALWREMTRSTS